MDRGVATMCLFAEVIFFSGQRKHLPGNGYRPDYGGPQQVSEGKIVSIKS